MRLLVLSNMYPSEKHPAYGTFIANFAEGLRQNGIDIFKVVYIQKTNGILKRLFSYVAFILNGIKASYRLNQYDLIYIHYPTYSLLPVLFNPFLKKKIVVNFHGQDLFPPTLLSKLLSRLTRHKVISSDLVVVPSTYYKDTLLSKYNVDPDKIYVSPSGGIDLFKFYPKVSRTVIESLKIGFLSRIDPGKGWSVFIDTLNILRSRDVHFHAYIGGGGSEFDQMIQNIRRLNISEQVTVEGTIPHSNVPDFFNKLDIFIFPSTRKGESLGLVALEALACGIPTIAQRNGAVEEFIISGYNGFIFEKSDPEILFEKIIKYQSLTIPEKLNMKINAVESIKKYESKNISKQLVEVLNSL